MSKMTPQRTAGPLLLPAPSAEEHLARPQQSGDIRSRRVPGSAIGGHGWSIVQRTGPAHSDVIREQRDGLARLQDRLVATIRRLEAENESLRKQLERYQSYPSVEQQEEELAAAQQLERERGIVFQRMPDGVYPDKPYVTQLDLIRCGITRYSRQNISRLTRDERSVPAIPIAGRVLLPATGVKALLDRERTAAADVSPRRRPGGGRGAQTR